MYLVAEDGITHLNVYSGGVTQLGRFASNFTHARLVTVDGVFQSVEGYWYYLGTDHVNRDQLKELYGSEAKKVGRKMKATSARECDPQFQEKIRAAIQYKFHHNPTMLAKLKANTLPLTHYYAYGTGPDAKIVEPPGNEWILDCLRELAAE